MESDSFATKKAVIIVFYPSPLATLQIGFHLAFDLIIAANIRQLYSPNNRDKTTAIDAIWNFCKYSSRMRNKEGNEKGMRAKREQEIRYN